MSEKEMLNAILEAVQKTNAELQAMKREFTERFDRIETTMNANFKRLEEETHFAIKKALENREAIRALIDIKK